MPLLATLKPGTRLYDRRTGHERLVHSVEDHGQVVFLSFKHPQTGDVDRQPFSVAELESRFEVLQEEAVAFRAEPEIVSLVAEAYRLQHAYLFNPLFATETSLIDLLPHQLAAVYGVPPTPDHPDGEPGMLDMPRLLRPASLYDTLTRGLREGVLVLRLPRADGSARTWWRVVPDYETLHRKELEVQPASLATFHNLEPELLAPERVEDLWPTPAGPLKLSALRAFFNGDRALRLAGPDALDGAVRAAVEGGLLMARAGGVSLFREYLPQGPLSEEMELLPPPSPVRGADLTPGSLPEAWDQDQATLQALADVLAAQYGFSLPWVLLRDAVDEALHLGLFELVPRSDPWPGSPAAMDQVRFRLAEKIQLSPDTVVAAMEYVSGSMPTLRNIKEVIERQFLGRKVPDDLFIGAIKSALAQGALVEADEWRTLATASEPLGVRVRLPAAALFAEAALDPVALQKLAEQVEELLTIAPELAFTFRVALSAEGQRPDAGTLQRLNELLGDIQAGWELK